MCITCGMYRGKVVVKPKAVKQAPAPKAVKVAGAKKVKAVVAKAAKPAKKAAK
jgi:hypothetical protein